MIKSYAMRALPFAAAGLLAGVLVLGLVLAGSDGTEPRGICDFVAGTGGLLPVDPNTGGSQGYSCNPNMGLAAFYSLGFGAMLSVALAAGWSVFGRLARMLGLPAGRAG